MTGPSSVLQSVFRLHIHADHDYCDGVGTWLTEGVVVNVADLEGFTPLMWAASGGHNAAIHLLLDAGSDINQASKEGYTALMQVR